MTRKIKPHSPWTGQSETFISEERAAAEKRLMEFEGDPFKPEDRQKWAEEMTAYIMKYKVIDESVEKLPGYAPGVHIIDGKRILVRK